MRTSTPWKEFKPLHQRRRHADGDSSSCPSGGANGPHRHNSAGQKDHDQEQEPGHQSVFRFTSLQDCLEDHSFVVNLKKPSKRRTQWGK